MGVKTILVCDVCDKPLIVVRGGVEVHVGWELLNRADYDRIRDQDPIVYACSLPHLRKVSLQLQRSLRLAKNRAAVAEGLERAREAQDFEEAYQAVQAGIEKIKKGGRRESTTETTQG